MSHLATLRANASAARTRRPGARYTALVDLARSENTMPHSCRSATPRSGGWGYLEDALGQICGSFDLGIPK